MSADSYKPNTTMTPASIAVPAVPSLNLGQPLPTGVSVERREAGAVNSANPAGGYCDLAKFNKG
jgi:hypothetical protein